MKQWNLSVLSDFDNFQSILSIFSYVIYFNSNFPKFTDLWISDCGSFSLYHPQCRV